MINSSPRNDRIRNLLPIDMEPLMLSRPSVSSRFTAIEVGKIIRRDLNAQGLTDVTFEFGITNNHAGDMNIELQSKDFMMALFRY